MVKVLQPVEEDAKEEDLEEEVPTRVVQNKISSFDHSSAHKPEDDKYNTAEDFKDTDSEGEPEDTRSPMALKTKDGKEILLPDYPKGGKEPRKKRQGITKGVRRAKKMPQLQGKTHF